MSTLKVNNIQSVTDGSVSFPQGLSSSNEPLSVPDGTVSSPSVRFSNDTDTGVYRIGDNTVGVSAGGSLRARIDNNGLEVIDGNASTPSISFIDDTNTGIFRSGSDQIDIVTNGASRFRIEPTGQIKAVYESTIGTDYNTQLDNGYLCRAWVNFNGRLSNTTGTYTRSGTTITCSITSHGLTTGQTANLDFTTGGATDGIYVVTITNANTFTVEDTVSGTITTSNVTMLSRMIRASGNVSSITDNNTGDYTVNFTTAMPDANYAINICLSPAIGISSNVGGWFGGIAIDGSGNAIAISASSFRVKMAQAGSIGTQQDTTQNHIMVFR